MRSRIIRKKSRGILDRTKLCESCGDAYAKPQNEQWSRWERRRYCSLRCWWDIRPAWNVHAINTQSIHLNGESK